ncbi:glycosyltransferase family 4 protein [Streptomyces cyaneofuscatus]|uniref:glycosyltransferase family 4 protein n=1 Tax=Streptomyces cyaneofuscatus TaxID=66883 RepID=UPI003CF10F7A
MPQVIASVVRVPWHTEHGGYDRLLDHLPEVRRITPPASTAGRHAAALAHRALGRRCPLPFYPAEHFATDLRVLASRRPAHVLYGDEQFYFSRHRLGPTAVTYHQPPGHLEQLLPAADWKRVVPRADAVITLAPAQREFFASLLPPERLHLVPHGIDTTAFSPGREQNAHGPLLVLTVGWWLRDFDVLDAVHERLHHAHGSDLELVVVTRQANHRPWHPAARVLEGISEDNLLRLYRRAAVLLLPLIDATANNAMLEALACGTPVIATDVGGIPYYAGDGPHAELVPPGDADAAAEAVDKVLAETGTDAQAIRRAAARSRAEVFAWPLIADQVRALYRTLTETP